MSDQPTPQSIARQAQAVRVERSDGVTGDVRLDEAIAPLEASVDAFLSAARGAEQLGTPRTPPDVDAGDVVARAHEAHQELQERLRGAQA